MQLTLSLLLALSAVFVCNFLCGLDILDVRMYSGKPASVVHGSHRSTHSHDHHGEDSDHHNDHQAMAMHQNEHNHSGDQHKDKDECCEEETNQLLASLATYELPTFETENIFLLIHEVIYDINYISLHLHKNTDPDRLNSSLSPPAAGSFIRVLHQSFLC
jgi:hypothetical protein